MKFILLSLLSLSITATAGTLPHTKEDFCSRFNNNEMRVREFSADPVNLMSFKNDGGLFNGGVCWWHSRFQRNVLYLAVFRPDLAKPNARDLKKLIKEIRRGENVFTIPGFANFAEFSKYAQKDIQAELNDWQIYDGVVLGSWMDGLQGDTRIEPSKLKISLDQLFTYVETKQKVAYQKLQIKGITSHSWLVMGMRSMPNGYEVGYVDSNNPNQCQNYSYKNGEDSFFIKGYGNFVPYLGFTREEERLVTAARTYCGLSLKENTLADSWRDDYERDLNEMKAIK